MYISWSISPNVELPRDMNNLKHIELKMNLTCGSIVFFHQTQLINNYICETCNAYTNTYVYIYMYRYVRMYLSKHTCYI